MMIYYYISNGFQIQYFFGIRSKKNRSLRGIQTECAKIAHSVSEAADAFLRIV